MEPKVLNLVHRAKKKSTLQNSKETQMEEVEDVVTLVKK